MLLWNEVILCFPSYTEMRNQHAWEVENEDRFPSVGPQEWLSLFLRWIW